MGPGDRASRPVRLLSATTPGTTNTTPVVASALPTHAARTTPATIRWGSASPSRPVPDEGLRRRSASMQGGPAGGSGLTANGQDPRGVGGEIAGTRFAAEIVDR